VGGTLKRGEGGNVEKPDVPGIKRIEYEGRIYVDLEDLQILCRMMTDIHTAAGMLAGAVVMEDVAKALSTMY
jgi:hypothetical protein